MRINFNNERKVNVSLKTLDAFIKKVEKKITGNSEHFWIGYKKKGKPYEYKWLRTQYTDEGLLIDVKNFVLQALKRK